MFRALRILALSALGWMAAVAADTVPTRYALDIPSQSLESALQAVALAVDGKMLYERELLEGKRSEPLQGQFTAEEAVKRLLDGTDLTYEFTSSSVVLIRHKTRTSSSQAVDAGAMRLAQQTEPSVNAQDAGTAPKSGNEAPSAEVVVIGTHIRGVYPSSSPVSVYDEEDIRRTGATTVEQFMGKLPENLQSLTGAAGGAFLAGDRINTAARNGVDLRGLGIGATLVLLNGRRLAPASGARTPDISLIPLSAVERIEVLTDGASAVYGADAIAGVVNFVLKERMDGAQTTLGYGSVTDGGHEQLKFDQSFAGRWASGDALLSYSYFDQSPLQASDRDYSAAAAPQFLTPDDRRHSAFLTFEQDAFAQINISGDLLYTQRDIHNTARNVFFNSTVFNTVRDEQYFAGLEFSRPLFGSVSGSLAVSYAQLETTDRGRTVQATTTTSSTVEESTSAFEVTAKIDGALMRLPAGDLKFSTGIGRSQDDYSQTISSRLDLDRSTNYAFAELLVPLPGEVQLSLAGRYTDYSDFGSDTSPKIGVSWAPVRSLNLRSSYGQSFRAATLPQMSPRGAVYGIFAPAAFGFPDIWSTNNSSVMLSVQGSSNSSLGPENSESFTAGFDFRPQWAGNANLSVTYFDIRYTDRILQGDPSGGAQAFTRPQDFPDLYLRNPSAQLIASMIAGGTNSFNLSTANPNDPASIAGVVNVVLDNRIRNLARSDNSGVDLKIDGSFPGAGGEFSLGSQLTHLLDFTQRITASAPVQTLVDTLFRPASLRGRAYLGFTRGAVSTQLNVNYVDSYDNGFSASAPQIASWTTLDWTFGYTPETVSSWLSGTRFQLNVQNLFDRDPPFVPLGGGAGASGTSLNSPIGFDPVNANALGRVVTLEVVKRWGGAGK